MLFKMGSPKGPVTVGDKIYDVRKLLSPFFTVFLKPKRNAINSYSINTVFFRLFTVAMVNYD